MPFLALLFLEFFLFHEVFEDDALGDLSRRRAWQVRQLVELARNLVEREVRLEEFLELADVDGGAFVEAVEAGTRLSAQFVLDADDGCLSDAGKLVDELLDLAR